MKEEDTLNEKQDGGVPCEKDLGEYIQGGDILSNGDLPISQKQLEAAVTIKMGRSIFQKDLEFLPWIVDTVQKIEEAESDGDKPDPTALKIELLSNLWGRIFLNSPCYTLPPCFEQFCAVNHDVLILVRVCAVIITKVPPHLRQYVIDGISQHIMDVPQITLEAKYTFKRCAEAGRIITLSPYETKEAVYKSPSVTEKLMNVFLQGFCSD